MASVADSGVMQSGMVGIDRFLDEVLQQDPSGETDSKGPAGTSLDHQQRA